MSVTVRPLSEITEEAMRVLRRELGVVDTLRFLSQFTAGNGNYTDDRHALLGDPSVEELFAEARCREAVRNGTVSDR